MFGTSARYYAVCVIKVTKNTLILIIQIIINVACLCNKLESLRQNFLRYFVLVNIILMITNIHKLLAGTLYLSEKIIPILNSYVIYLK